MREVSSRILALCLETTKQLGLPPERLTQGLPVTVEAISDPSTRIDWDVYCELCERFEALCGGPEKLELYSTTYSQAPAVGGFTSAFGLFTSPRALYWAGHRWFGHAMFTVVESEFEELPDGRLRVVLSIPEGYRGSTQFFRINAGVFRGVPRLLGQPDAQVSYELSERRCVYTIVPPPSLTVWARLGRAFRMLFGARGAFEELARQQAELRQRFDDLSEANRRIIAQADELETVNLLARELTSYRDLDPLAQAVTALFERRLAADGVEIQLSSQAGVSDGLKAAGRRDGPPTRAFELRSGDESLGRVLLWGDALARPESLQLIDRITPWVSIAFENAVHLALLKAERLELEGKVEERTHQLRLSLERLTEFDRQKTQFFANASHELRTPLTLILLPLERLVHDASLTTTQRDEVQGVLKSTYRLLKLVNDLLDLSKIEAGRLALRYGRTELTRLLVETTRPWGALLQAKQVVLVVDAPESLELVADAERLEQIVLNLLSNAVKHTPRGGRIEVGAKREGELVNLWVGNTGEGIAPGEVDRLFDRFAQSLKASSRQYGTTGLGLPVVKELIELHGGRIWIDNVPGARITFRIQLPVGPAATEVEPEQETRISSTELTQYQVAATSPESPRTTDDVPANESLPLLLFAEDNDELRSFVRRSLVDEYRIIEATDGEMALELAQRHLPDLVLSDLMMPKLDGIELCRELKRSNELKSIPFVLLTARTDLHTKLEGLNEGADDYLVKPFHVSELKSRLRAQRRVRELSTQVATSEKLGSLGRVVAGVAHEIRNPLNGIINALEPLGERFRPGAEEYDLVEIALDAARRVEKLTEQLLRQARAGEGERTEVDIGQNIAMAIRLLSHKLDGGPLMVTKIGPERLTIIGEPGALVQVWINLIDNAIYASGRDGKIQVTAKAGGPGVQVEVADSGPGIEPQNLRRIFDPFFTTKPVGAGTGLGLAVVRSIVEAHGGQLEVRSSAGKGTTFRVTLPGTANTREMANG